MGTSDASSNLSMKERREKGLLWVDTGENLNQQIFARGLCQDFNQTRATESEKRAGICKKLFASCGENEWIEPPLTVAMGNTVSIGDNTYINSNLTLVDDYKIHIGTGVLIAPNVTISTTNHPMHYKARTVKCTAKKLLSRIMCVLEATLSSALA